MPFLFDREQQTTPRPFPSRASQPAGDQVPEQVPVTRPNGNVFSDSLYWFLSWIVCIEFLKFDQVRPVSGGMYPDRSESDFAGKMSSFDHFNLKLPSGWLKHYIMPQVWPFKVYGIFIIGKVLHSYQCCGSGSGSRRARMTHKSEENSSFEVLDVLF
jgi:hypothetical protein